MRPEPFKKRIELISSITIENFIIIDRIDIDFDKGFSSITGETGTGKSIILDAINFCFGKFSSKSIKKFPEKDCLVEIKFDSCTIKKVLDKSSKTTYFLNGNKLQNKEIKDLMPDLIDITAQSDSIITKVSQRKILDEFIVATIGGATEDFENIENLFQKLSTIEAEISQLEETSRIARRDKAYHQQIVTELEALDIKENEETELLERRAKLAKLCSNDNSIKSAFNYLKSAAIQLNLSQAIKSLEKIDSDDTNEMKDRLESAAIELADITSELEDIASSTESREMELSEIDERLSVLRSVARKFNTSASTLFEFFGDIQQKLQASESFESKLQELLEGRNLVISEYDAVADRLHELRITAAKLMSEKVCEQLSALLMPNASFRIDVSKDEVLRTQHGKDDIEFMANFNKNTALMSFSQIASGGEAARLNFALKTVLGVNGKFGTIIFDEVDIGIGGAAAYAMGNAMRKLAEENDMQVISITHSPQVAARAHSHILIKKSITNESVSVSAKTLSTQERINEIARMISGETVNDEAILAAQQLLL